MPSAQSPKLIFSFVVYERQCRTDPTLVGPVVKQIPPRPGVRGLRPWATAAPGSAPAARSSSTPTFHRAFARWCFTVECERPRRWAAAFSDPASITAVTTATSRSVARSSEPRAARARLLTPPASRRRATRRGPRSGSCRLLTRARHQLREAGDDLLQLWPTSGRCGCPDAAPTLPYNDHAHDQRGDGVGPPQPNPI